MMARLQPYRCLSKRVTLQQRLAYVGAPCCPGAWGNLKNYYMITVLPYGDMKQWCYEERRGFSEGTRKGVVMPCRCAHSSTASIMRS